MSTARLRLGFGGHVATVIHFLWLFHNFPYQVKGDKNYIKRAQPQHFHSYTVLTI